jgi:hypothetical protein
MGAAMGPCCALRPPAQPSCPAPSLLLLLLLLPPPSLPAQATPDLTDPLSLSRCLASLAASYPGQVREGDEGEGRRKGRGGPAPPAPPGLGPRAPRCTAGAPAPPASPSCLGPAPPTPDCISVPPTSCSRPCAAAAASQPYPDCTRTSAPPPPQDPVALLQAHPDFLANSGAEAALELTADYGELSTKD